jgi:hypothetical protein
MVDRKAWRLKIVVMIEHNIDRATCPCIRQCHRLDIASTPPGISKLTSTAHRYIRDLGPSSSAFAAGLFCATSERIAELTGLKVQEAILCGTGDGGARLSMGSR